MATHASRSRAFFLELVLDLVVFALCAVVSIQVFIEARVTSSQSSALSHLSIEAQAIAETFKANDGNIAAMIAALDMAQDATQLSFFEGSGIVRYYDSSFNLVADKDEARYQIHCRIDASKALKIAFITVIDTAHDTTREIFSIEVRDYVSNPTFRGGDT